MASRKGYTVTTQCSASGLGAEAEATTDAGQGRPRWIAFGSDYPYWDAAPEEIRAFATSRPAGTARGILHDNADLFFADAG
jgi:predicted TIM-barrel fold metal-dependent hydrolase